jgi:hypothetical protein
MTAEQESGRQTRRLEMIVKTLHLFSRSVKQILMHLGIPAAAMPGSRDRYDHRLTKTPAFFERTHGAMDLTDIARNSRIQFVSF